MPCRRHTRYAKSLWTKYVLTLLGRCLHVRSSQQALIHADAVSPCSHELAFSLPVTRPGMETTARLPIRQMTVTCKSVKAHHPCGPCTPSTLPVTSRPVELRRRFPPASQLSCTRDGDARRVSVPRGGL